MNTWVKVFICVWMFGLMGGHEWMNEQVNEFIDWWVDEWMNERVNEFMKVEHLPCVWRTNHIHEYVNNWMHDETET